MAYSPPHENHRVTSHETSENCKAILYLKNLLTLVFIRSRFRGSQEHYHRLAFTSTEGCSAQL